MINAATLQNATKVSSARQPECAPQDSGLSVSYGIIRDMVGTIEVSNKDQGARFKITLPITNAQR